MDKSKIIAFERHSEFDDAFIRLVKSPFNWEIEAQLFNDDEILSLKLVEITKSDVGTFHFLFKRELWPKEAGQVLKLIESCVLTD